MVAVQHRASELAHSRPRHAPPGKMPLLPTKDIGYSMLGADAVLHDACSDFARYALPVSSPDSAYGSARGSRKTTTAGQPTMITAARARRPTNPNQPILIPGSVSGYPVQRRERNTFIVAPRLLWPGAGQAESKRSVTGIHLRQGS
eukprot:3040251-Rhodomonas_salina.2